MKTRLGKPVISHGMQLVNKRGTLGKLKLDDDR